MGAESMELINFFKRRKEKDSNQILDFTKEIKNMKKTKR